MKASKKLGAFIIMELSIFKILQMLSAKVHSEGVVNFPRHYYTVYSDGSGSLWLDNYNGDSERIFRFDNESQFLTELTTYANLHLKENNGE
jgi:hypothetical protein